MREFIKEMRTKSREKRVKSKEQREREITDFGNDPGYFYYFDSLRHETP